MRSHGSSLWGFGDNILQGWFKMKTTSIFPVHGLASLILMSKYAQSRQFFVGVSRGWFKMKTTSIFPVRVLFLQWAKIGSSRLCCIYHNF